MPSILNNPKQYNFVNGVRGDCVEFSISGISNSKLGAQTVQMQMGKSVTPIYEIGTNNYYLVDGRVQGRGTIACLFGPTKNMVGTLRALSNVCDPQIITIAAGSCADDGCGNYQKLRFIGGTLVGMDTAMSASNFTVSNSLSFVFIDVESVED